MSTRMMDWMPQTFALLRYDPIERHLRGVSGGVDVVDTKRALVVWEPRRVVPTYAVPAADVRAELTPAEHERDETTPVLTPLHPYAMHTAPGEAFDLTFGDTTLPAAAFRFQDDDLADYLGVDFDAFDHWYEENVERLAHPRDPYHRVDVLPSSRHVRIEHEGILLAESDRPTLVCETFLPTRFYLPRDDVVAAIEASDRRSACAYKGHASYLHVGGVQDIAWTYAEPLDGATPLAGLVAFYNDVLDVYLDGELRERPGSDVAKTLTTHLQS